MQNLKNEKKKREDFSFVIINNPKIVTFINSRVFFQTQVNYLPNENFWLYL